jgi:hypothetical protein
LPLDESHTRLSYKSEREVARSAQEYVSQHPDLS